MKTTLSCHCLCNALAHPPLRFIAVVALSLFFAAGIMPASSHAQTLPQTDAQEQGRSQPPIEAKDIPAQALFNQATLLEQEDPEKAVTTYEQVMQRFGRGTPAFSRLLAARALLNKGGILGERGEIKEAIITYERIEKNFGNEKIPAIREVLASALVSKAETFYKQGNAEKTLATYTQLNQQFSKDDNDFIKRLIDVTRWRITEIRVAHNIALSSNQ